MKKKGRPASAATLASRYTAKEFLDTRDASAEWRKRLDSDDENVALKTWIYLNDRVYGKPAQAVDMTTKGEAITQLIVNL